MERGISVRRACGFCQEQGSREHSLDGCPRTGLENFREQWLLSAAGLILTQVTRLSCAGVGCFRAVSIRMVVVGFLYYLWVCIDRQP